MTDHDADLAALLGTTAEYAVPPSRGFGALLGLRVFEADDGSVAASLPVGDHLKQPFGVVHGGVYAAIAESVASIGTARAVRADGGVALGQSNNTSFFRPVSEGSIHARSEVRHRGRTTWVWQVDLRDDDGRLCASSTLTIAVRRARPEPPARDDASPE